MVLRRSAALVILALVVAACAPGEGSGGQLAGTDWVLRSYDQDGSLVLLPEDLYVDAEFGSHKVSGSAGCNSYDARFRAGGRMLLVAPPTVTRAACPEEAMALEATYLALLQESRFYSARRDTLTIFNAERETVLVFDAAPRNPLLGTWLVDSFATGTGSVTAPLEGTRLDVVFGIASVGGSSGCNSFSGTYGTNGSLVRIGRLATTRMACEPAVMDQEAAFIEALEGAAFIEAGASRVDLTDRSGSIVVALVRPSQDEDATASPSPSPDASPSMSPEPSASPSPSPEPSPSPTPAPSVAPSPTPSTAPPTEMPTVGSCDLAGADETTLATIAYPGTWSTVTEPPELACRYFDPAEITVPGDPATLSTAVMVAADGVAYADAVAAATDPAVWSVRQRIELTVDGLPATLVEAEATSTDAGLPVGTAKFAYLVDAGPAGTITLWTTGTVGDEVYVVDSAVVSLMTALSVFGAPS
jgi:heat shock protein HslJ